MSMHKSMRRGGFDRARAGLRGALPAERRRHRANPPPAYIEKLRDAGARPVAELEGVREPLPPGVIYDPPDADYVPLAGFEAITRPGPNIVIWELPAA